MSSPNATSRQVGALGRSAARRPARYLGKVEVARDAQKTDGEPVGEGPCCSTRTATVNAKPELEIFADDVKCAHGATVGELDAQRAVLPRKPRHRRRREAKALLTRAFVADALDRIGDEAVREAFEADARRHGWRRTL